MMLLRVTTLVTSVLLLGLAAPLVRAAETEPGVLVLESKPAPDVSIEELLNPDHPAWPACPELPVHFNHTPPIHATDPKDSGTRPEARVQLLRRAEDVVLRLHWSDTTDSQISAGARYPDAGEGHVYKQHSQETNLFSDALCAMVPQLRGPQSIYPSMMMGEGSKPVDLYYWKAGAGFEVLNAHGRTSTAPTGQALQGNARRDPNGWTVTLALPNMTKQTPVCFAIWDGSKEHRDGLKYFSLWYEVG
jgi:hypothetical protein